MTTFILAFYFHAFKAHAALSPSFFFTIWVGTGIVCSALPKSSPDQQSLHFPGHTPVHPYLSGAKEDWLGFVAGFRFIGWLSQQLVPDFIPKRVPFY